MATDSAVLELLGLITRSFGVGSEPDGEQEEVSNIPLLQTEKFVTTPGQSAEPVPRGDNTANEKAEGALMNIQRLVGQIDDIENVVERVGTNLQVVQNDGVVTSAFTDHKIGGLFSRQNLQGSVEKTVHVIENIAISSNTVNLSDTHSAGDFKVLDEVNLCSQLSERKVASDTDNAERIFIKETSIENSVVSPNSKFQNTLPAFLSSQLDSVDKASSIPSDKENTAKSLLDMKRYESSGTQDDNTKANQVPPNTRHVAHIAYSINPPFSRGQSYIMQKHNMAELTVKPFMCGICGDIFSMTSKLSQHVTKSHSIQKWEGSEIDRRGGHGGSKSDLSTAHASKEEILSLEAVQQSEVINDKLLENLEQSLIPEDESKTKNDCEVTLKGEMHHGKYESRSSTERSTKKRSSTAHGDGEGRHQKRVKRSNTESEALHPTSRQCQQSDNPGRDDAGGDEEKIAGQTLVGLKGEGSTQDQRPSKSGNKTGKAFKCEFCEVVFTSNKYRYKHRVASHPEATFQCPGCQKSFKVTEKDKWQHHIRVHDKPPPKPKPDSYRCDICLVAFRAPNAVAIHMQRFHPETVRGGSKPFCCELCGNLFRTRSALKSHQTLVHSDEKPFQCGTCGKVFKKESYLKLHRRTHTGEKPFMCKFCDKTFPSTTGRRCHERTHTNEKPYKCSYCGSSFRAKPQLVEHERTHTQERPFVCGICGKSFASRTSFKTHKFLHTGSKPHKCGSCSKTFAQKSNLTDHFRSIHSQEKPYHCTVCDAKFTRSTSRKVHMEKKHGLKITVRQGRPPIHESDQAVDSIVATCLSIDVSSVLTPIEQVTLGDALSIVVNNQPY